MDFVIKIWTSHRSPDKRRRGQEERKEKKQIYRLKAKGKFSHGYTLINTDEKIEAKGEKIYELRVASHK